MGGWLTLFGNVEDLNLRVDKFDKIFSIENVPALNMKVIKQSAQVASILWSWKKEYVPDVYFFSDKDGDIVLLCGAPTGLAGFDFQIRRNKMIAQRLLDLWKEHGESIIKRINGSWSLLFYSYRDNTAKVFTDRFASRSIWISRDRNTWIVGNFPSSIVALRQNRTTLDPAGLWSLFQTSRHIPGKGLYNEVFSLTAGQKAILGSHDECNISNWWRRRYKPDRKSTAQDWGYILSKALRRSGSRIKQTTAAPHLFLSGGLDSRVAAASLRDGLKTLTICSSPNFESRIAEMIARNLGLGHETITRSAYWFLDSLNAAALISSGNYFVDHVHFIHPVIETLRTSNTASFMLGDPLENLNKHYFNANKVVKNDIENLPDILLNSIPQTSPNPLKTSKIFSIAIQKMLYERWLESIYESYKSIMDVSDDVKDRLDTYLRWIDVSVTYTYNMITCIWPFAEERTLFYDNELNDIALQIQASIRGRQTLHRWILWYLKKALLMIPDANNFLPMITPKIIQNISMSIRPHAGHLRRTIYRYMKYASSNLPTSGSWPLRSYLYREDKRYRSLIGNIICDKDVFPGEIFNMKEIKGVWNAYLAGDSSMMFDINALLSFATLHRLLPTQGI